MFKNSIVSILAICCTAVLADVQRVERRKPLTANIGVVSVGLDTYWKQCPGLYEDMLKKAAVFEKRVESHQAKVTSFGISDNPKKAASIIPAMKAADLDLLFVDMVTYATSSTFAPFVRERAFEKAYKAAGNRCEFLEYSTQIMPGLTGHCIWVPKTNPHRLISVIEERMTKFIRGE